MASKRSSSRGASPSSKKGRGGKGRSSGGRAAGKPQDAIPRGCRLVMGIHSSVEAIRVSPEVKEVWLKEHFTASPELRELAELCEEKGVKVVEKKEAFLASFCQTHQGVGVVVKGKPSLDWDELGIEGKREIIIALDEVVDPHNVGAIMRTSWLLGAKCLLVPEMRSSHLTPTATKVASGGAEHVPLINVGNLGQGLAELKEKGFWIYGLAGEEGSKGLWDEDYAEKTVWVVGSEAKGLRPSIRKQCDQLIAIPQIQVDASYNASVALSIALAESKRQAGEK